MAKRKRLKDLEVKRDEPLKVESVSPGPEAVGDEVTPEFPEPVEESPEVLKENVIQVSPEVAGDILNLPFAVGHIFNPAIEELNDKEVALMSEPFSRLLTKWGLAKISRDEIIVGFWLSVAALKRFRAVVRAKNEKKRVESGSREEGHRQDNVSSVSG